MIDLNFLRALLVTEDASHILRTHRFKEEFLEDAEVKRLFQFATAHKEEFHKYPSAETLQLETKLDVLTAPPENLAYYCAELESRKTYQLLAMATNTIASTLMSDNNRLESVAEAKKTALSLAKKLVLETTGSKTADIKVNAEDRFAEYLRRKEVRGIVGVPTYWPELTDYIGGWQKSNLYMFLAKEGTGKTLVLLQNALAAYRNGFRPLIFTEEMDIESLALRFDSLACRLPYQKLLKGELDPEEELLYQKYLKELGCDSRELFINEGAGPEGIDAIVEISQQVDPDLILIDNIYLYGKSLDWKDQAQLSMQVKKVGTYTQKPTVFTNQLNDAGTEAYSKGFGRDVSFRFVMNKLEEHGLMAFDTTKARSALGGFRWVTHWDFETMTFDTARHADLEEALNGLAEL